ncbi:hypothetical protein LZ009_09430 [Ramlibacter sp. XY19]|uniref:hypothetical protein n=1 Tax=Ramlibacter paludis TaxID=2908000 RepID=UPI0023DA07C4|nr:hypothetical protein [Ramlibacter paludis]MCG2593001.1 hypothetical protein [Ramlibacter paludis]
MTAQTHALIQLVAGIVFAAITLWFLWQAFDSTRAPTQLRYDIVHYVCSLGAGASGAFFTGAALLSADVTFGPGSKLAFQGTAGVALFGLVFLLFRSRAPSPSGNGGSVVSIGTQTPFEQVAQAIASEAGATIDLSSLSATERAVVPASENLLCGTFQQAKQSLARLGQLVPKGAVRAYRVDLDEAAKHFTLHVLQ